MKVKKILITGVLGFIGRSLAEKLIKDGCKLSNGDEIDLYGIDIKDFPTDNNANLLNKGFNYRKLDIRDESKVRIYLNENKFDGVVHLAAVSRVAVAENDKKNCIATNFCATENIMHELSKNGDSWVVFASSREVYGECENFPNPTKETDKLLPINIYGFYKLRAEQSVQQLIKKYFILRFSNVYGNLYDLAGRVIPNFVSKALNNEKLVLEGGDQVIDFTYIDDTIECIVKSINLLNENKFTREIVHICPGKQNKITDIIGILKEFGYNPTVEKKEKRIYDVEKFVGNTTKQREIFGQINYIDLKEGIKRYIDIQKNKKFK